MMIAINQNSKTEWKTMSNIMPQGDAIKKAIKWISATREEQPDLPIGKLVQEATVRFDLSPKDSEFLLNFCRESLRQQ